MQDKERVLMMIEAAEAIKAEDIILYDLEKGSSVTDYMVLCSGRSQAHVRGICDKIEEQIKESGGRPQMIEGYQEGSWVLMDCDVVFFHIFHPETRAYYDLEGLLNQYPHERFTETDGTPALTPDKGAAPA